MKKKRTVGHSVRTLDNMMFRSFASCVREHGLDELTTMHGWILGFLSCNEGRDIFQKDIESEFQIGRSTVTNIVKLMEKKGYIRREAVPYDARLKKLVLTDTGRALHEATIQLIDELEGKTTAGIEKEDLETFFTVIEKLKENVKTNLGETTC
ncbi:MAG: MarR family winged helix-turn-helix transcriptional regulator [Fusicatenibacter sp.]|nr:MarR family transcriptional regulator [Fusicatenibacter sp.]